MSIIKSSTTATTAYIVEANTNGDLVLQTGAGPTTALTVSSAQAFTFEGSAVFNEAGADKDFRVEGDTDANLIFADASTDRVGIGTSSPATKLAINGGVQILAGNALNFQNAAADANGTISNSGASGNSTLSFNSGALLLNGSGNLGLGVSPSAWSTGKALQTQAGSLYAFSSSLLDVNQNAYYDGAYKYVNTAAASFYRQNSGTHSWSVAASGTAGNTITFYEAMNVGLSVITLSADEGNVSAASSIRFRTDGTERMRLDLDGNLLVGTTTAPGVNGGGIAIYRSDYPRLTFRNSTSGDGTGDGLQVALVGNDVTYDLAESGYQRWTTAGTERARITSEGRLLVNHTSNTGTLAVKGIVALTGGDANTYAITCGNDASDAISFGSTSTNSYIQTWNGRNLNLNDQGNAVYIKPAYNNTTGSAANVFVDSAGFLQRSTSSLRYKTDVKNATHGLAEVLALRPVTYKGINDGETIFGGLIAEEIHDAGLIEFVAYDAEGKPDALHYGNMVSLLIKAIQEQQAMINDLKAKVAALESK